MHKYFPAEEVNHPEFSSFVSFDIETTGLDRQSEIIEIGAVRVINGKITDSFNELVKPQEHIPWRITQITGINDKMTQNADGILDVLPRFAEFAGNDILVGHNAVSFDCKIMGFWADNCGVYIDNKVFDTLRFVKYRCEPFPCMEKHNLAYLCDYFDIHSDIYHRATADAEVTAKLYMALKKHAVIKDKRATVT